jgi:Domain of unknown function (DUF5597)/Beta-galactosidase
MNIHSPRHHLLFGAFALAATALPAFAAPPIPHLEKRGAATQLIVDGQPYLILGGETANTATSSPAYMNDVWPRLARMNLNTVLVGVGWDWIEPAEGKYDFSLVDAMLAGARREHLRLVLLWFGSWKNGISSFAPAWVKADQTRFPRVQIKGGASIEVLSTFAPANREADTRAYVALMRHLAAVDAGARTVLMIQMENEVGVLGDSRDRSAAADAAFAQAVPKALTDYLARHEDRLNPDLRQLWAAAGSRTTGTWTEVFGPGPATDEIFMAWHYARYLEHLTAAGKAEYPLPVYTNTWIVQPEDTGPGDFPSGGPEPLVLDVWKAGAPSIDLNAPDIYLPNFTEWCARFHRPDNPLFVPESRGDAAGAANAFYAIGRHAALGYSPFGIDNAGRLLALRPAAGESPDVDVRKLPLPMAYAVLRQLAPLILAHQASGTISAVSLNHGHPTEDVTLGNYVLHADLRRNRRDPGQVPPFGYGLFIALGPDEYLVAGSDLQVTFTPTTPGPPIAGIATAETGSFVAGKWVAGRRMNGDDILLDYKLAEAAADHQSGSGLRFGPGAPMIQRVTLYRYR